MTRIFVDFLPETISQPHLIELDPKLTHHLRDVLRLDEGKQLTVVCRASSKEYLAIVAAAQRDAPLKVQILKLSDRIILSPKLSTLACGLPKGTHADQICEQVSQLGVEQIVFWCADRSVAQPKQAASRLDRWQKIAETAARQSKQNKIPQVRFFESSSQFFRWLQSACAVKEDLLAVCSLQQSAQPIISVGPPKGCAHLVVGPEGDFSSEELEALDNLGATQISLGPLVLRVETAAIASCAMALAAWGWKNTE